MADWKEALDAIESLVAFAYEQGFHELGYQPEQVLRAHIEGLEAQRDMLLDRVQRESPQLHMAEARVRELEPNASRYLYLRNNTSIMIDSHTRWLTSHRLDAVVDAAIATTEQADE